ncbi:hypothetical protein [Mycobacterium conspicuum]|uniref:Uncharacterized protein n=1 Tax=Mycobacterium conspicuum TaxID=44010 RepID=A0A1X1T4A6_9MYCO|nr:hypothetical protein [Mycobacterium conspicuum]ORV39339.1 hypothetical protein AWC00_18370 [Mycobacterium conspicuum]BBZ36962.1 hypothetical protein MCNS_00250 [Mycobacterium conspicuum]
MSISNEPAASRRFVAHPPFWGSKWASLTNPAWQKNPVGSYLIIVVAIIAFTAVFGGLYMAVQSSVMRHSGGFAAEMTDKLIRYGAVALLFGGVGGWYWWSQRSGHGNLVIDVTGDGMTVSKRPGDVYRFADATLGVWGVTGGMTMGTALHLRCGPRRFILGGRDFRAAAGTRLDAPDAGYGLPVDIDAWVTGAEFGEILAMAGRRGNHSLAVRPPDPGEPTRCLLFPSTLLVQQMGPFAMRRKQQLLRSVNQPRLAIDVDAEAMRVVDLDTNALVVASPLAQVSAVPETYRYRQGFGIGSLETGFASSLSTTPVMVVHVPGMQPLSIGCRDSTTGLNRRFSWPRDVHQRVNDPPDFSVSGADWLTLVEKFGLTPYLQRHDQQA